LVNWFGKRYLEVDNVDETHHHTHVYLGHGEPPGEDEEDNDEN